MPEKQSTEGQTRKEIIEILEWLPESPYPWEVDFRKEDGTEVVHLHHDGPEINKENEKNKPSSEVGQWFGETNHYPTQLENHTRIELSTISEVRTLDGSFGHFVDITCDIDDTEYRLNFALDEVGGLRCSFSPPPEEK